MDWNSTPVGRPGLEFLARAIERRHGSFIRVYLSIIQLGALDWNSTGQSHRTETWKLHSCLLGIIQLGALDWNSTGQSHRTETWKLLLARAIERRHGSFIRVYLSIIQLGALDWNSTGQSHRIRVYLSIIQLGALDWNSTGQSHRTETWKLHSCLLEYHPVGRPGLEFYWPEP